MCILAILLGIWKLDTCSAFLESIHGCPFDVVCRVEHQVTNVFHIVIRLYDPLADVDMLDAK